VLSWGVREKKSKGAAVNLGDLWTKNLKEIAAVWKRIHNLRRTNWGEKTSERREL